MQQGKHLERQACIQSYEYSLTVLRRLTPKLPPPKISKQGRARASHPLVGQTERRDTTKLNLLFPEVLKSYPLSERADYRGNFRNKPKKNYALSSLPHNPLPPTSQRFGL